MTTLAMATADVRDLSLVTISGSVTLSSTQARTGSYSYRLSGNTYMNVPYAANATIYARIALYLTVGNIAYIYFKDGTTNHITLYITQTGVLNVYRSTNTLLYQYSNVVNFGAWNVFEFKLTVNDSTGALTIKLNGGTIVEATNIDTRNGANAQTDNITISADASSAGYIYADDIVVDNAAFPGLGGIVVLSPTGNGTYTSWTNDYTYVDDNPPDDDTSYIYTDATVTGTKENFTCDDLPTGFASVPRIGLVTKAKLDGAGAGNIKNTLRSGGSDYEGSSVALSTSYTWAKSYWDTDPADAGAWSKTKVDALEVGVISA